MSENQLPTIEEFTASGGDPANFEVFLGQRKKELAEKANASAKAKSRETMKIRIRGGPGAWRQGQVSTMIPSQAPFSKNEQGHFVPCKPEPGITVPIGKVVEIPVRDAAHRECLEQDQNIEVMPDDALTAEQEAEITREAVEKVRQAREAKAGKK